MNIYDLKMSSREIEHLIGAVRHSEPRLAEELQDRISQAIAYRIAPGMDSTFQFDMFPLIGTLTERFPFPRDHPPDYHAEGVHFFESVKNQVREAVCGKNGVYQKERRKIESSAEACVTTLLPVVLAALHLPGAMAGGAVVIVLMISKIGVRAFCESTAPIEEQKPQVPKSGKKTKKKAP